jgi:hypothetical protein
MICFEQFDRPLRTSSTENERSTMGNAKLDACSEYNQRTTNAMGTVKAVSLSSATVLSGRVNNLKARIDWGQTPLSMSTAALGHRGPSNRAKFLRRTSASVEPRSLAFWYQVRAIAMSALRSIFPTETSPPAGLLSSVGS